jgi:hypothetical protein
MRWMPGVVVGVVLLGITSCAYVGVSGSVIVHDNTGQVLSAAVTNDGVRPQALRRFPGGLFFGFPTFDGVVEVRCLDGSKDQAGYVTGGLHTSVTVVGSSPCRLVENP